jgi:multidrug efflux pump subunit AcrA (membrane-fusion protein)
VQIVPAADPASRSFVVKIELPANRNLRSGLFGRACFQLGEYEAIALPRTAVVERGQLQGLLVVGDDHIATLRYVTLGQTSGDKVEILSGVNPGEYVIAAPGGRELAGKRIEVR